VAARSLIDAGGQTLVFGPLMSLVEDETAVAIAALHDIGVAHLQPDPRMA
jgi:hypothetical protein